MSRIEPDTEYEVRLTMKDPDGVTGQAIQKVRTRGEPQAASGGRTLHVYLPDFQGSKQKPAFTGLLAAYYGSGLGDCNEVYERKALHRGNRVGGPDDEDDAGLSGLHQGSRAAIVDRHVFSERL
jgi:hypothetical protein